MPAGWAEETPSWASDPFEERVKGVAAFLAATNTPPGEPYPSAPANQLDASLLRLEAVARESGSDPINHPAHYAEGFSNGAEVIDITENLNFNRGNAVKYLTRAGRKDPATEIEDLRKAGWYVDRELARLGAWPL